MKKATYEISFKYMYVAEHKRSHYTIDGLNFMNHGELCEVSAKDVLHFVAVKDANTSYDEGSDIQQTKTSIKSADCGLTDRKLANNLEDFIDIYFQTVHSTNVKWVVLEGQACTIYSMNMKEFRELCDEFARWDKHSQKVKIRETQTMLKWLEAMVA